MSVVALIRAVDSLKKREGDLAPTLKTVFFEGLKNKFKRKTIRDVLSSYKGGSWGNDYFSGAITAKVLRSPDIRFGIIDFKNAEDRYFTEKEFSSFSLKNNDILVIKSNGSLDLVGKSQIYKEDKQYPFVIASNFLMVLTPKADLIYPEYLDLFLKSPESLVWRFDTQKTTTGLRNLNTSAFLDIEIPVPDSIEEQKMLFESFQSYLLGAIPTHEVVIRKFYRLSNQKERLSNELTHQLTLVKKLRQQLLQDAVQGKLVPQDVNDEPASVLLEKIKAEKAKDKKYKELPAIKPEEIPFDIPDNWVWCRLDEICKNVVDCPHSTPKYLSTETGYFGIDTTCIDDCNNISKLRYLSKEGFEERIKRLIPQKEDIVYAREGSIGLATFIPENKNICLGQRVMLFRSSIGILPKYLINVVTTESYKNKLLEKHRGMGAKHVNVKDIVLSLIPLPPISEQHRIIAKLEELMHTCGELEASINVSKVQNEQLLQQVLREALR